MNPHDRCDCPAPPGHCHGCMPFGFESILQRVTKKDLLRGGITGLVVGTITNLFFASPVAMFVGGMAGAALHCMRRK